MNLYRLDFLKPNGTIHAPVRDFYGDVLCRAHSQARLRALNAAADIGMPVGITRIRGAGHMRRIQIAHPNGKVTKA